MNTKNFINLYDRSKNDITGKYLNKIIKYWADIVHDSVKSSEITYLYSVLTNNRDLQFHLKETWGDELRYKNIRKVALTLKEQDVLGVIFIVYKNNVYGYDHNFDANIRVKPIRECQQFDKMKTLMLDAEKDLTNKANGKYEFCPIHLKWIKIPIQEFDLSHLCFWLFDKNIELSENYFKHNLTNLKKEFSTTNKKAKGFKK